ncbi:hypothetical protein [Mucilaginibacter sp.]
MKIIKYIFTALVAVTTLGITSCTKKADVDTTETKLPALQLSSLGYQQSSPFTTSTILQLQFGATTTNVAPGKFTVEFINTTAPAVVVSTATFNSWSGYDATYVPAVPATATTAAKAAVINHTISYTLQPTTYYNTQVYSGLINLKLSALGLVSGNTYTVRATAYTADGSKTSVLTQSSFFKVQN